jgi:hypothetical protein
MKTNYFVDRNQGTDDSGLHFGYVCVGDGGFFFTWDFAGCRTNREKTNSVLSTIEADTIDAPSGRYSMTKVEKAIRNSIKKHGFFGERHYNFAQ